MCSPEGTPGAKNGVDAFDIKRDGDVLLSHLRPKDRDYRSVSRQ